MMYAREALTGRWIRDGVTGAYIQRIYPTGAANVDYMLSNPLGYVPVGVQLIKKDMAVDCFVKSASINNIVVQFTLDDADVTIRVW